MFQAYSPSTLYKFCWNAPTNFAVIQSHKPVEMFLLCFRFLDTTSSVLSKYFLSPLTQPQHGNHNVISFMLSKLEGRSSNKAGLQAWVHWPLQGAAIEVPSIFLPGQLVILSLMYFPNYLISHIISVQLPHRAISSQYRSHTGPAGLSWSLY